MDNEKMCFSRDKIYKWVYPSNENQSYWYEWFMIIVVIISLVPLTSHGKSEPVAWKYIDYITTAIFVVDYIIRWSFADKCPWKSFVFFPFNWQSNKHDERSKWDKKWVKVAVYPLSLLAIIDLLSILPIIMYFSPSCKILRSWRVLRWFRFGRLWRYSVNETNVSNSSTDIIPMVIISKVIYDKRKELLVVVLLATFYILAMALVVFDVERDAFDCYWDAVYWATNGKGNPDPGSTFLRVVNMITTIVGVAFISLPSAILIDGYKTVRKKKEWRNGKDEY